MPAESFQKRPPRVRPPFVHLTYQGELRGEMETIQLPFIAGVLADLSGNPENPLPALTARRFVEIDRDNFERVLEDARPRVELLVPGTDGPERRVVLTFRSLADFSPENIALQIPPLNDLLVLRDRLGTLRSHLIGNDRLEAALHDILCRPEQLEALPLRGLDPALSGVLFEQVCSGKMTASPDLDSAIFARIAELDREVSLQLSEVMHHPDLQRLEAAWRALWYFVDQTETASLLKIRVLNITKRELRKDLEKAIEFDQSTIFHKVYEEEYDADLGFPYSLLVADYAFSRDPRDVALLTAMSQVASVAQAPFIAGVRPEMFNQTGFTGLTEPIDLNEVFDEEWWCAWRCFRLTNEARFVGLVLPRMLLRLPYGKDAQSVERLHFEEQLSSHEHYLWGNAAFALAARITDSYARCGWFAGIQGMEEGGIVPGLPAFPFRNDVEPQFPCPVEITLNDPRAKELARQGFISLRNMKHADTAVFLNVPSCYRTRAFEQQSHDWDSATATLACALVLGLFAHYLRWIYRDRPADCVTRTQIEQRLNQWLRAYVLDDDEATPHARARAPLRAAHVELSQIPQSPHMYKAVLFIEPVFQLPKGRPLRAVVELPHSDKGALTEGPP